MKVYPMTKINNTKISQDLMQILIPYGLDVRSIIQESESYEYGACEFEINKKRIKFRYAKITPRKVGQFVTIWKRIESGPIMPFDMADLIEFFIISVHFGSHSGLFIFPKSVLHQKGYISKDGRGGKRAMRVYPSWDIVDSPIAQKTQEWQRNYFIEISPSFDRAEIIKLLA